MGTRFQRPAGEYNGDSALANRTKYQIDATSVPAVPIDDIKVDGDINYAIDALNTLDDSITSLVAGSIPDGSITTAKLADSAVTTVKVADGITRTKLATGTANRLVGNDSSGVITDVTVGSELTISSSSLTITSAGITNSKLAAGSVDGSKFSNQSANTVLAGPSSGSSTAPTFRALALADMPTVAYNNMQVFTSSGTFTPSSGVTKVFVEVWGAGGGGGGTGNGNFIGAGGGGGGYTAGFLTVTPSTTHTVTVGVAGTAGSSGGGTGGTGGTSSFAGTSTTISSTGGGGGSGSIATGTTYHGGSGGVGSSGTLNLYGEDGDYTYANGTNITYSGGSGGSSPKGGRGARGVGTPNDTTSSGASGKLPGGGGSGGCDNLQTGGAGANGMVIVYYP